MSSEPNRAYRVAEGVAALLCVLLAGWALACIQADQLVAAKVLAIAAAAIPVVALLARVPGIVERLLQRRPIDNRPVAAANRD